MLSTKDLKVKLKIIKILTNALGNVFPQQEGVSFEEGDLHYLVIGSLNYIRQVSTSRRIPDIVHVGIAIGTIY